MKITKRIKKIISYLCIASIAATLIQLPNNEVTVLADEPAVVPHSITVNQELHGTIKTYCLDHIEVVGEESVDNFTYSDSVTSAVIGDLIYVKAETDAGWKLQGLQFSYTDADHFVSFTRFIPTKTYEQEVPDFTIGGIDKEYMAFNMPDADITVTPVYVNTAGPVYSLSLQTDTQNGKDYLGVLHPITADLTVNGVAYSISNTAAEDDEVKLTINGMNDSHIKYSLVIFKDGEEVTDLSTIILGYTAGYTQYTFPMPAANLDIYVIEDWTREEGDPDDSTISASEVRPPVLTPSGNVPCAQINYYSEWSDIENGYATFRIAEEDYSYREKDEIKLIDPQIITFVLDDSGSMGRDVGGGTRRDALKIGVMKIVDDMRELYPDAMIRVNIVLFQRRTTSAYQLVGADPMTAAGYSAISNFVSNKVGNSKKLNNGKSGDNSHYDQGMMAAEAILSKYSNATKTTLIFGDFQNNGNWNNAKSAAGNILSMSTADYPSRIYSVVIGSGNTSAGKTLAGTSARVVTVADKSFSDYQKTLEDIIKDATSEKVPGDEIYAGNKKVKATVNVKDFEYFDKNGTPQYEIIAPSGTSCTISENGALEWTLDNNGEGNRAEDYNESSLLHYRRDLYVKVKLKDNLRYKVSDTEYAPVLYEAGNIASPTMTWDYTRKDHDTNVSTTTDGETLNTDSDITQYGTLRYGVVGLDAEKTWSVKGNTPLEIGDEFDAYLHRSYANVRLNSYIEKTNGAVSITPLASSFYDMDICGPSQYGTATHTEKTGASPEYGVTKGIPLSTNAVDDNNMSYGFSTTTTDPSVLGFSGENGNKYSYRTAVSSNGIEKTYPLILYDNFASKSGPNHTFGYNWQYYYIYDWLLQEDETHYATKYYTENNTISGNTLVLAHEVKMTNEPNHFKVITDKVDAKSNVLLHGAEWTVYQWNKQTGAYEPYYGLTTGTEIKHSYYANTKTSVSSNVLTGNINGRKESGEPVKVVEKEDHEGHYESTDWLMYSALNEGKFRLYETKAPKGYYGDWKDGITPTENSGIDDLKYYDFTVGSDNTGNEEVKILTNNGTTSFANMPSMTTLTIMKQGEVYDRSTSQNKIENGLATTTKPLANAWYVVRTLQEWEADEYHMPAGSYVGDFVTSSGATRLSALDLTKLRGHEDELHVELVDDKESPLISPTDTPLVKKAEFVLSENRIVFEDGSYTESVFVTGVDGKVTLPSLRSGAYEIIEVKAPDGYTRVPSESVQVLDTTLQALMNKDIPLSITFTNAQQETSVEHPKTEDPDYPVLKEPSIKVSKTIPKHVFSPGEKATYYITVTNTGEYPIYDTNVVDYLTNGNMPTQTNKITRIDYLGVGDSREYQFEYTIPSTTAAGTHIDNVVVVSGEAHDERGNLYIVEDSDTEAITVNKSGLLVTKQSDKASYRPGETIRYKVEVTNTTGKTMSNVRVDDMLTGIKYTSLTVEGITDYGPYVIIDKIEPNCTAILYYAYQIPKDYDGDSVYNDVIAKVDMLGGEHPSLSVIKNVDKYAHKAGDTVT